MCRPAPGNYAVDEMAGRKIERMVLESRGTSQQFACRSCATLPPLSFSSLTEIVILPSLSFFFFNSSILYRYPPGGGSVYSNNQIFSEQDPAVDREF